MAGVNFRAYLDSLCDTWKPSVFEGRRILVCAHGFGVQNQDFPTDTKGRRAIQQAIAKGHRTCIGDGE